MEGVKLKIDKASRILKGERGEKPSGCVQGLGDDGKVFGQSIVEEDIL